MDDERPDPAPDSVASLPGPASDSDGVAEAARLQNEADWTSGFCNYLRVLLLAALGIALSVFLGRSTTDIDAHVLVPPVVRTCVALALYSQVDYYRKNILNRLPGTDASRMLTLLSGVALAVLATFIVFMQRAWLFGIGVMMTVVFIRNAAVWLALRRAHPRHEMQAVFGRWTLATLGYAFTLFAIAPLHYALKTSAAPLILPFGLVADGFFIDVLPGLVLCVGMAASIQRLSSRSPERQ